MSKKRREHLRLRSALVRREVLQHWYAYAGKNAEYKLAVAQVEKALDDLYQLTAQSSKKTALG